MKYHASTELTENGAHIILQENAIKVNNADFSTKIKRTMVKAIRNTTRKIEDVPRVHTRGQITRKAKARVRARRKEKAVPTQETPDPQVEIAIVAKEAQAKADMDLAREETKRTTIDIEKVKENEVNLAKKTEAKIITKITRRPQASQKSSDATVITVHKVEVRDHTRLVHRNTDLTTKASTKANTEVIQRSNTTRKAGTRQFS